MTKHELPVAGQPQPERVDAARNRRKILDAAAALLAERGPEAVTMNSVAHAAGMGVGTVYRRFGDISQLLHALLDDGERRFQEAFLAGPPPLGPGAPPLDRLRAFLCAVADRTFETGAILRVAEAASPRARYRHGPYLARHTHVAMLLREMRPGSDPTVLAHLLLAPFAPSLFAHLAVERGLTRDEIKAGVADLLTFQVGDG